MWGRLTLPNASFQAQPNEKKLGGHGFPAQDLESFLQSSNLSTHDTQVFLRLVDRVLEDEVAKRLEKHHRRAGSAPTSTPTGNGNVTVPAKPSLAVMESERRESPSRYQAAPHHSKAESPGSSTPESIAEVDKRVENAILETLASGGKLLTHELKTVNTRLNYGVVEEAVPDQSTTTAKPLATTPVSGSSASTQPASTSSTQQSTAAKSDERIEFELTPDDANPVGPKDQKTGLPRQPGADYRSQLSSEFNRLLELVHKDNIAGASSGRLAGETPQQQPPVFAVQQTAQAAYKSPPLQAPPVTPTPALTMPAMPNLARIMPPMTKVGTKTTRNSHQYFTTSLALVPTRAPHTI